MGWSVSRCRRAAEAASKRMSVARTPLEKSYWKHLRDKWRSREANSHVEQG